MMKKLISILILLFVFCNYGQAVRIISNFDIARWYLDADLVLICNVTHTDTITISKHDTLVEDGYHLRYDILREKYNLSIDSIIKGEQLIDGTMDSVFTPYFTTQSIYEKKEFKGLDSNGDSIFYVTFKMYSDYNDDGYFRIKSKEKRLVILRKSEIGYVIDYVQECDSSILALIKDVKMKGEDYFSDFLSAQSLKPENVSIYPNPCSDVLHIDGIQVKRLELTELNGKTQRLEIEDPNRINLKGLKPGVYVVTICTDNKKWTQKIIKE